VITVYRPRACGPDDGTIIIENVNRGAGMGYLYIQSISHPRLPGNRRVQPCSTQSNIGNMLVDIMYGFADPRMVAKENGRDEE